MKLAWINIKMALATLRGSKLRSLLTMLGIIIGVTSVITVISIGEGVKKQVESEINSLGSNLAQVQPGKTVIRDEETGEVVAFDFSQAIGTSTLSEADVSDIDANENIESVTFFSIITGSANIAGEDIDSTTIMGTNDKVPEVLNQELEVGSFFGDEITNKNSTVIGYELAIDYFLDAESALGRSVTLRGESFTVVGVAADNSSAFSNFGPNLNRTFFVPYEKAKEMNQGIALIQEIDYKVIDVERFDETNEEIRLALIENRGGEEDFSIIKSEELVAVTNSIFSILTSFVAAIAAISLVVGGIGIMNIMLVSVTERTKEIGIRKAIGASNRQILFQFLVEALTLSLLGGLIGVFLAMTIGWFVAAYTELSPALNLNMIILATSVSALVGIVFGIAPAWQAARKDPIESLRHE